MTDLLYTAAGSSTPHVVGRDTGDVPTRGVVPFSLTSLLAGRRIYEFSEFYAAKNLLLRYDERRGYLNYGYWPDGDDTANPSAELVAAVARAARIGPHDVVVNIGSGLGQPDVDIVQTFGVDRVIGINLHAGQAEHANGVAAAAGLAHAIEHRRGNAEQLASLVADVAPTRVIALESLAEMPNLLLVLAQAFAALAPGGTLALCDIVTRDAEASPWLARPLTTVLSRTTAALYGDHWRSAGAYVQALRDAGFSDVRVDAIGSHVYSPTYRHARSRLPALRQLRCGTSASLLAYLNLRTLDALYRLGRIDYAIVSATKDAYGQRAH